MKFSIVIPTYNRPEPFQNAFSSAVAQSYEDFEVIVSNNNSNPEVREFVEKFNDKRVRYFETDRLYSMPEHFSYIFNKVEGEWFCYLGDDDALTPDALSVLAKVIDDDKSLKAIRMAKAKYIYPDFHQDRGNEIEFIHYSGKTLEYVDAQKALKDSFWNMGGGFPKVQSGFFKTSVFHNAQKKFGEVFDIWAPDISSGLLVLSQLDRYGILNVPIHLYGISEHGYGAGSKKDPSKLVSFLSEFDEFTGYLDSPYPRLITVQNIVYETYERVRRKLGATENQLAISQSIFREKLLKNVCGYIELGFKEFEEEERQLKKDMALLGHSVKKTRSSIRAIAYALTRRIKRMLAGQFNFGNSTQKLIVSGREAEKGFSNISEAATYIANNRELLFSIKGHRD